MAVRTDEFKSYIVDLEYDTKTEPGESGEQKLKWVKCPADKFKNRGGYQSTTLREDTAESYNMLYDVVHRLGGILTSAGGKRGLVSKAGANRSKTSLHYVGRAFDMALPTGMQNPETDPFIIVRDDDTRYWTVWCVSSLEPELLAAECQRLGLDEGGLMTLEGTYLFGKKVKTKTVTRTAFNFTVLARGFGFDRIPARPSFFSQGSMTAAEWWHFSWRSGLIKMQTTFGAELLKIYPLAQCKKFIYWADAKNAIYGKDFFG